MNIVFENISTAGGLKDLSLEIAISHLTVLYDPCESVSGAVISTLVGLDEITSGKLTIDGIPHEDFINPKHLLANFAYVFEEGTMLANLTIRENLLLPWRKRFEAETEKSFDLELKHWMKKIDLNLDINLRPAIISPAQRKFMGFIRAFMLKPQLLLIEDPYYIFNKTERACIFSFLNTAKQAQAILIASADDDFTGSIADRVIDLSSLCLA